MASKYLKKFPIPQQLPLVLHDFAKAVMMQQPQDVLLFAVHYFQAKAEDRDFIWQDEEPRVPRPVGYPRVKGRKQETAGSNTSKSSPVAQSTPQDAPPVQTVSTAVVVAECAKEFLNEVVEKVIAQRQARV